LTARAATRAGVEGKLDEAISLASSAWQSAAKAKEFDSSLNTIATQMQTIAKTIADRARSLKAQP
jgi:hypothetical protein